MPARPRRTEKLDLRLTADAKKVIVAAASASHRSVTDFVVQSALASAEQALADKRVFLLNDEQWAAFQKALDAPPRVLPKLKRLLERPSVFEESEKD